MTGNLQCVYYSGVVVQRHFGLIFAAGAYAVRIVLF